MGKEDIKCKVWSRVVTELIILISQGVTVQQTVQSDIVTHIHNAQIYGEHVPIRERHNETYPWLKVGGQSWQKGLCKILDPNRCPHSCLFETEHNKYQ